MNIVSTFYTAAKQYPNNIALVEKGNTVTFDALLQQVNGIQQALKQAGVKEKDNVMVVIPFSGSLYAHILAVFSMGARVVLVDSLKPKERLLYAFKKAKCTHIVTLRWIKHLKWFLFPKNLWNKLVVVNPLHSENSSFVTQSDEDTALITFTSGSTGNPKAANRTHGFLNIQLQTIIDKMALGPNDIHLTSFPVVLMCNLAVGAASLIPPKKERHRNKIVAKHHPTVVSASPFHTRGYLQWVSGTKLRALYVGGATILPDFFTWLSGEVEPNKLQFIYGSTEAEPIATFSGSEYPGEETNHGVFVGKPHPNISVKIMDLTAASPKEAETSTTGQIVVAGPHVLSSYFEDDEAMKENKLHYQNQVWHNTGDCGYMRDEKLFFLGRFKYTWQEGGTTLSPILLEVFLSQNYPQLEGTWMNIQGKNVAFLNTKNADQINSIKSGLGYSVQRFVYVSKLPRDKRHFSRINYEQLKTLVD